MGGGLGGKDECAGVTDDKEELVEGLRPGGGGYDMMNDYTVKRRKVRLRTGRLRRNRRALPDEQSLRKKGYLNLWYILPKDLKYFPRSLSYR